MKPGSSRLLRGAFVALLVALSALPLMGSAAVAEEALVFNAAHSLTGTCETSSVDPIEDPGCPGGEHPGKFIQAQAVTTDTYGDTFLASLGPRNEEGQLEDSRVDVFSPSGVLITSFRSDEGLKLGPINIAVDSDCNLYVASSPPGEKPELRRYPPKICDPAGGNIEYGEPSVPFVDSQDLEGISPPNALAIDPRNQHLFVHLPKSISEYQSAAEGNGLIERFGAFGDLNGGGLAIDATHGLVYATDFKEGKQETHQHVVKVLELEAPHAVVGEINGSCTPSGKFLSDFPPVAVNEATGNVFVYDAYGSEVVYEFTSGGECLATIDHELSGHFTARQIAVDNGAHSPNGALHGEGRYLYVPAYIDPGYLFAFGPSDFDSTEIDSIGFSSVTEHEALLQAEVNPNFLDTSYRFEYTREDTYEEEGFEGASVAGGGKIPAGSASVNVSAVVEGLTPGTVYRFRITAQNELGGDEAQEEFATYPELSVSPPCPNDAYRVGPAALLPDCRAYELVTPPSTGALAPIGLAALGFHFATRVASPAGNEVSLILEGGAPPGSGATGGYTGDPYLATRTGAGWNTSYVGPTPLEAPGGILPGSNSPDQGYAFWKSAGAEGIANVEGEPTSYLRYPDGHSALLGRGSLATDPFAIGHLISESGSHVIFGSKVRLEENAPGKGTGTVYDRTIDPTTGIEQTHVISLLPEDETPEVGEGATYVGASLDGRGVAFDIGSRLYLRYEDEASFEIGENLKFAGIAEGGARLFYLQGGDLYRFDVNTGKRTRFTISANVIPVNIAPGGAVVYFISPSALTSKPNPNGVKAKTGTQNLYRSAEGEVSFVGTVTERDVVGEYTGIEQIDGLGLWTERVGLGQLGADPSRTTPNGNALLFESRARLDGYDPEGHPEVYRYDFAAGALTCLSCNPTLARAAGEASLESIAKGVQQEEPFTSYGIVSNLTPDGRRAYFQSTEPLVPNDTDWLQDVYEWKAQAVGTCERPAGCLFLISGGHSPRDDYLYGVSDTGDDVFFRSGDFLLGSDQEETPSIYDARVGGGFPESASGEACEGEGCRPGLNSPPNLPTPGALVKGGSGSKHRRCPAGKRKARRHGKVVCVKKERKHHRGYHQNRADKSKEVGK